MTLKSTLTQLSSRPIWALILLLALIGNQGNAQNPNSANQLNSMLQALDRGESIVGEKVELKNITFETGKSNLTKSSHAYLDTVVIFLQKIPNLQLRIVGHTDSVGQASSNQQLSEERAQSVKRYFARHHIAANRLASEGFGSSRPVASNATEAGRQLNRRVELEMYALVKDVVRLQDIVHLEDGTRIGVAFLQLGADSLAYRKFSGSEVLRLSLEGVDSILYARGEVKDFTGYTPPEKPMPHKLKANPQAGPAVGDYLLEEFGIWLEYFKGPRMRSGNFEDMDLSNWESHGLMSADPNNVEGRVRLPFEENSFKEGTHGLNIGILIGLTSKIGAIGEYQLSVSSRTLVKSYMLGANYDLASHQGMCLSAIAKIGLTRVEADLGYVESVSGYSYPAYQGQAIRPGHEISAVLRQLSFQSGLRADFPLKGDGVRLSTQLGIGGTLIGSRQFFTQSPEGASEPTKLDFRDGEFVHADGGYNHINRKPRVRSMGVYFSIGYAGFAGRKRRYIY